MGDSEGKKFDSDKLRLDLLSIPAMEGVAKILGMGAKKYGERNWQKGLKYSRVFAALLRHLFAWWNGEELDNESQLNHIHHVACNIMFLQHFVETKTGIDDRAKKEEIKNEINKT